MLLLRSSSAAAVARAALPARASVPRRWGGRHAAASTAAVGRGWLSLLLRPPRAAPPPAAAHAPPAVVRLVPGVPVGACELGGLVPAARAAAGGAGADVSLDGPGAMRVSGGHDAVSVAREAVAHLLLPAGAIDIAAEWGHLVDAGVCVAAVFEFVCLPTKIFRISLSNL